jgi:hypothetical protein
LPVRRARPAPLAYGLVAFALAGCGGGSDGEDDAATTAGQPAPVAPISEEVAKFEDAVKSLNCDDAVDVVHPVVLSDPEHPDSHENCASAINALRAERGVEVLDSQELGTGAVVDTRFRGNDETLLWALDASGRFKYTASYITRESQVGTEPDPETDFQGVADDFVAALRDEDCKAAFALLAASGRLGYGSEKTFCDKFADTFTKQAEGLSSRLQADPEATAELLEATRDIAVFGLATEPAGYRTLFLATPGTAGDPVVVDLLPTER